MGSQHESPVMPEASPSYSPAQSSPEPVFYTPCPAEAQSVLFIPKTAEKSAGMRTVWSWGSSNIRKVKYNDRLAEWMAYDQEFTNWVKTCLMVHADNGLFETVCNIPDRWREDIGDRITIVTADCVGSGRGGERLQKVSGVFHVMA